MAGNEIFHYGVLGMRWRHHQRESAADRANRAHDENQQVKNRVKSKTDPYHRNATDWENTAKRTGKASHAKIAKRARRLSDYMDARYDNRITKAFERKESKRDEAVKKIDRIISEKGELKLKSVQFDRWLERHPPEV